MIEIKVLESQKEAFEICQKADDYFQLMNGKSVTQEDIEEIFNAIPPSKSLRDKLIFGIYSDEKLVGLADIIKNYPQDATWWLGLFLIAESNRESGIGKLAHEQLIQYSKNEGAVEIRLGVDQKNIEAVKFWEKVGYTIKQIKITDEQHITVMKQRI